MPSTVPRPTHVHAPGRVKSGSRACAPGLSSAGGATRGPDTDPSALTVASSAQRVSAWPPAGASVRTPTNASSSSGCARKTVGRPTSSGAVVTLTLKVPVELAVAGPATVQSVGPPDPGPTNTLTP